MTKAITGSKADPAYHRGLVMVLSAGVCWSSMGLAIRLMEAATAWQILFYRSLSLTPFVLLVIMARSGGRPLAAFRGAGTSAVLGGLALVAAFSGGVIAIQTTTVANAMFLFATAPFLTALLGRLILGESVRGATWIAMLGAAVGIALMVSEGISLGYLAGNVAAVVAALGFALFTIALRWKKSQDMMPAVFFAGVFTVIFAGAMCLAGGQSFIVSERDLALSLGLGVFQIGVGLALYTMGSNSVPAAELALLSTTEVVLGPFWVWLFLGETAGLYTLLGGAILIAAISGNALSGLRRRPPPMGLT